MSTPRRNRIVKRIDIDHGEKLERALRILGWEQRMAGAYFGMHDHNGQSICAWVNGTSRVPDKHLYKLNRFIAYADMVQQERERFHQIRLREAGLTV